MKAYLALAKLLETVKSLQGWILGYQFTLLMSNPLKNSVQVLQNVLIS